MKTKNASKPAKKSVKKGILIRQESNANPNSNRPKKRPLVPGGSGNNGN